MPAGSAMRLRPSLKRNKPRPKKKPKDAFPISGYLLAFAAVLVIVLVRALPRLGDLSPP